MSDDDFDSRMLEWFGIYLAFVFALLLAFVAYTQAHGDAAGLLVPTAPVSCSK